MIGIIDYGMGNLYSVRNALDYLLIDCEITDRKDRIDQYDGLILPGVGAFPDAMRVLRKTGLGDAVVRAAKSGIPLLGICLGMQLLFEDSVEFEKTEGLSLIPGHVIPIEAPGLKIPHMGWNDLTFHMPDDPISKGLSDGAYVYFVHSFRADTEPSCLVADTTYGIKIPALVRSPVLPVYGAQFHPEKSHDTGMRILSNFNEICKGNHV